MASIAPDPAAVGAGVGILTLVGILTGWLRMRRRKKGG